MTGSLYECLTCGSSDAQRRAVEEADGRCWTFQDLFDLSGRIAWGLVRRGVAPGDRIMVQAEKSVAHLALFLAVLRAGAVFLPLNTAYTDAELDYFIGDAEPALIVCDPARQPAIAALAARVEARVGASVETLDGAGRGSVIAWCDTAPPDLPPVPRASADLAAILYTSGTTGRSKGAMLSHGNLVSNIATLVAEWRFSADDVLLHALPIFHTHGLFVAAGVALAAGARMIFLPKFEPAPILAALPRASVMMGVPTFYTRLLQAPTLDRALTAHMRLFVSGSAPLLSETHAAFEARTGHRILERYGMTETSMLTSNPYAGERIAGTVGFPLPGVALRIVDPESCAPQAPGAIGMIEVRGPNVFGGYWRMPAKTAAEFRPDGFFITGDLGLIDGRGSVQIVGRAKDLVITGGYNVYPKEVEAEIDALPGVLESAVIGLPDPDFGEAVAAVVVPRPGARLDTADIAAALAQRLAKFKCPKSIFVVDTLPRNAMGKVQKQVLRATYGKEERA